MKPYIRLFIIAVFSVSSLQAQINWGGSKKVVGNGDVVTSNRDIKNFDGIKACCSLEVELTPGGSFSVEVEAESNLQEFIRTEVNGKTLSIGFKENTNINNKKAIKVYVTLPKLTLIDASSSADIRTNGLFKGDRLRLESSSGSTIMAEYSGERVVADASSGAGITVAGSAESIEAEASSGAKVRAEKLQTKTADADVSSGASIDVQVSERLKADASSGGRVYYAGSPRDVNTDTSSGGSIRKQ